jgi:DNA-binding MarR family transcriptional regulator
MVPVAKRLMIINLERDPEPTDLEDEIKWVLGVDRRMLVMKEAHENGVIRATQLAEVTGRSVQNISHAIHEMEAAGLIECLTPEKSSWKRYILTDVGKKVSESLRERHSFD